MPWGFAAAGLATVAGSLISSDAAQSAANTQANAANNASATQLAMFDTTQKNLAPYMSAGSSGLGALMQQLGLWGNGANGTVPSGSPLSLTSYGSPVSGMVSPNNVTASMYQQSPGYQWQLSQGLGSISNAASASGGINGGNTLKSLMTYGQGLANQDYQQWYNNYVNNYTNAVNSSNNNANTAFNRLQTIAGSGQNAAANLGSLSSATAGQIGQNIIGAGNAQAAGTVGSANALTGGINNLSNLAFLYQMNPNLFSSNGAGTNGALSLSSLDPGGFGG